MLLSGSRFLGYPGGNKNLLLAGSGIHVVACNLVGVASDGGIHCASGDFGFGINGSMG